MNRRPNGYDRYRRDADDAILERILAENGIRRPDLRGGGTTQVLSTGVGGCMNEGSRERNYTDTGEGMRRRNSADACGCTRERNGGNACGYRVRNDSAPDADICQRPCDDSVECRYGYSRTYGVTDRPLGIVYSPIQEWKELYDLEEGLSRGTIFKQLYLPLEVGNGKGGNCRG